MPQPKPAHAQDDHQVALLRQGYHNDPHAFLGAHVMPGHPAHVMVRAFHPSACGCDLVLPDERQLTMQGSDGFYTTALTGLALPCAYRLRWHFADGSTWSSEDPYRFLPTFGSVDQHLFNEGKHYRLWDVLGAHPCIHEGVLGVAFALWAPNARRVSIVGDFCQWDGRRYPMRSLGSSGVFELFLPDVHPGSMYKYEIVGGDGRIFLKTDPMAQAMELPPGTASVITQSHHQWHDHAFMQARRARDPRRAPVCIYEVHLGAWARVPEENNRPLTYRELASKLVPYIKENGFNAVEFMPITEYPFSGSWGYQVSGYYAPTSRYGTPDDLRFLIDACHQNDISVLIDWVPAHFPKDAFALAQFDGTHLYEHADPRMGEHPDWGTLIFNYGRTEVRNFLIANALYWLESFHVDGLRVDAVASMLYLDYSREAGAWLPNKYGGRENLDAIEFLQELNTQVSAKHQGAMMIAEESTAWPMVTGPVDQGGLGFTFKWNMGWMHDTLKYFAHDAVHRRHHQSDLTFSMIYEYTENFVMPLSHDEVVHGKGSLLRKMSGDAWQKFANMRLLFTYQYTRPGKKLLFMGCEFAPWAEWNHDQSLDWHIAQDSERQGMTRLVRDLGLLYQHNAGMHAADCVPEGFFWIDAQDSTQSVFSFVRQGNNQQFVVAFNMTSVPRDHYRIGMPKAGTYTMCLNSDQAQYGGSDYSQQHSVHTEPLPYHGQGQSALVTLPPLAGVVLTLGH